MRLPPFLASRGWLLLLVAPFAIFWSLELSRYAFVLDTLFGGDAANQLGIATHIANGSAPWEDASFRGEWAFRDWLMHALVALLARLLGAAPLDVMRYWPVLVLAAGGFALHGLGRALFGRERYALLAAGLWMAVETTMIPTSRYFAALVTVPLFFWALAAYEPRASRKVLLGLAWGAASLSYLVAFFGTTLALGAFLLHRARGRPRALLRETAALGPAWLVGLPIVLALWGPLLVVYGGHVQNPSHLYGDAARGWTLAQSLQPLQDLFLHWGAPVWAGVSLLAAVGLYAAWQRRRERAGAVALLVLAVGLAGTYHWLVTLPLFGNHLVYYRWPTVFLRLAQALLVVHAVALLDVAFARWRPRPRALPAAALVVALLLAPAAYGAAYRDVDPDHRRFAELYATHADARAVDAAATWLRANAPEAVVLGTALDSFAIHALTGTDLVVQRRSHANPFVDMDGRSSDAVLMLMGHDVARGREIAAAYGATHAFFSPYFAELLVEDPLMTSPAYADEWRAAGIEPLHARLPHDPVGDAQLFDVIVPKAPGLGTFLVEDWDIVFREPGAKGEAVIMAYRPG